MKKLASTCALIGAALGSVSALAQTANQTPDPQLGRNLAATCAACHGTDGRAQGAVVALAGYPADKLIATMAEYKAGQRPATIMHQIAKGYSDAQITQVASYFAQQKN